MRAIRRFTVRTVLPGTIGALGQLALNLRSSWHTPTQDLFASIDPNRWAAVGHDPVRLLGDLPPEQLDALSGDRDFVARVDAAAQDLHEYLSGDRWYQGLEGPKPQSIAYFSAEYGITSVLPQ